MKFIPNNCRTWSWNLPQGLCSVLCDSVCFLPKHSRRGGFRRKLKVLAVNTHHQTEPRHRHVPGVRPDRTECHRGASRRGRLASLADTLAHAVTVSRTAACRPRAPPRSGSQRRSLRGSPRPAAHTGGRDVVSSVRSLPDSRRVAGSHCGDPPRPHGRGQRGDVGSRVTRATASCEPTGNATTGRAVLREGSPCTVSRHLKQRCRGHTPFCARMSQC